MKLKWLKAMLPLGIALLVHPQLGAADTYDATGAHGLVLSASGLALDSKQLGVARREARDEARAHLQLAQQTLAKPSGRVLLTISGAIDNTNGDGKAAFDREMLLKLGTSTIRTSTSWTDGVSVFEGVLATDVMRAVGSQGSTVIATALNDYVVEIPVEDFEKYGVILALSMDGKELTARNKGPIWAIYPRDDFPELRNRASDKRWIWQLVTMEIR